ncbi:unnamed protein product [Aureobasidium vineae]|uniref:Uncharacterized protein n=1 Tax=Aureobasidium vineae TaxID=2773715 RepID=A0A9N8P7M4_9PEZI|nr:unnamed protein product [Aureobasidium vineae]
MFEVYFDHGRSLGNLTVTDSGEKTVQETWLCIDEDNQGFAHLMINDWPGLVRDGLKYNLTVFEAMFMTTDLRVIELGNTKLFLGGLLSLLDRNKETLDVLKLINVDTDADGNS